MQSTSTLCVKFIIFLQLIILYCGAGTFSKCYSVHVLHEFFLLNDCRQHCSVTFNDSLFIHKKNMLSNNIASFVHSMKTRLNFELGLSRFESIQFRSRSDRFDLIHYPFVQTNTTKISNSECHLNDLLEKITMNKITMNKEHKIVHNTSASNCNNVILFVMLDKNQFVGIFWQQCH